MERYSGVKSAERMFDIVELLNRCRGASVTELATKSGFSRRALRENPDLVASSVTLAPRQRLSSSTISNIRSALLTPEYRSI